MEKREKHLESLCEAANTYIGLARLALSQNDPETAMKRLDQYCEKHDRLEVRYIGAETADGRKGFAVSAWFGKASAHIG